MTRVQCSGLAARWDDDEVADGERPSDGSGVHEQSAPAEQPPPAAPTVPATPAPTAGGPEKTTWKTLFAALPGQLGNGLTHLGRWLTHLGRWLARLARRLARLSEIKPTPLQKLGLLSGLAAAAIFGALAFPANPIGQACVIAFVPGLCITIGILGTRWHTEQGLNQHLVKATQHAVYTTLQLKRSVRYVDERLSAAQHQLEAGTSEGALIEVVRAKTATELSLGGAEQASRPWGSALPIHTVDAGETRAADDGELISGSVARVEGQYTVIINRGSAHGIKPDMVFAVLAEPGDPILDPETGEVIGELPSEKLRVKVIDVQPKYSRAVTYRTFASASVEYPALTGSARLARELRTPGLSTSSTSRSAECSKPSLRNRFSRARKSPK